MKSKGALLGAIFFLAVAGTRSAGQTRPFVFEHLSQEQGLAQVSISCVNQDQQGFLWLGTEDGLVRYDGYSFMGIGFESDDPAVRASRRVSSISVGADGDLWVAFSERGLARLNPVSGKLAPVPIVVEGETNPVGMSVTAVTEDRDGNLWLGTSGGGLFVRDAKSRSFTRAALAAPLGTAGRSLEVTALFQDLSGGMWVGTRQDGLFLLPGNGAPPLHYANIPGDKESLSHNSVTSLAGDADGNLWIGTAGGGLNRLVRKGTGVSFVRFLKEPKNPASLSHDDVRALRLDRSGALWIGTFGGGINVLDPGGKEFVRCLAAPKLAGGLSNNLVNDIFIDRSGVIWVGTWGSGLNKLNPWRAHFGLEQNDPDNPLSLGNNDIRCLVEDRSGTLWIGTGGGGLNSWKRTTGNFFRYLPDEAEPPSSGNNIVSAVHEDRRGRLWAATATGKLLLFDPSRGRFALRRRLSCGQGGSPRIIFEDRSGNLWLAGSCSGLIKMNGDGDIQAAYRHDPGDAGSFTEATVYDIREDASGFLWLATGGGLIRFDPNGGKSLPWPAASAVPAELLQGQVYALAEEPAGNVFWIGSSQGLFSYSFADNRFAAFGRDLNLPPCEVAGIVSGEPDTLWLATNKGLVRVHPRTKKFKIFTVQDGLQADIFNVGAIVKGRNGGIFAGGPSGLNWFQPGEIRENPHVPSIVLTDVRIGPGSLVRPRNYPRIQKLDLYVRDRPFTFYFSALDFADPAENRYSYHLQGKGLDRVFRNRDRALTLTRLNHGRYTLRATGANSDGVWNEEGFLLALRIVPPFWQTRLVSLIIILMLSALALYILWMQRRVRRAKKAGIPENLDAILAKFAISRREAEVLRLLLAGKSNREIENDLHIAMATVKIHVHNIFRKMEVGDRLHLLLRIQSETQQSTPKKEPPGA